jgi:hypothetical protein
LSRRIFASFSVLAVTAGALRSPLNRSTATVSPGTVTNATLSSSGAGSVSIVHLDGMKNRIVQRCSDVRDWPTGAVIAMPSPPDCWATGAVMEIS